MERVAKASGFSLHAGVNCKGHQKDKRKRIFRYIVRPPVASPRLCPSSTGKVVYTLKTPYRWNNPGGLRPSGFHGPIGGHPEPFGHLVNLIATISDLLHRLNFEFFRVAFATHNNYLLVASIVTLSGIYDTRGLPGPATGRPQCAQSPQQAGTACNLNGAIPVILFTTTPVFVLYFNLV